MCVDRWTGEKGREKDGGGNRNKPGVEVAARIFSHRLRIFSLFFRKCWRIASWSPIGKVEKEREEKKKGQTSKGGGGHER